MKDIALSAVEQKERRARTWTVIGLVLILLLGAFLRFYQLGVNGSNEYYAAAVKSMLTSWHNFFFVSYEPGGSVSVDKPPLGFWIEALSARVFGVNSFALALPNALAGELSILLLFFLVKKPFGRGAALTAALALACMPITVAAERNNTIDGMLVFTLLLATWAFMRSIEKDGMGYLLLGAVFLGLAFNIKMLQAFMVLPALYLLYLLGARCKWGKRLLRLSAATVVLAAVSLSWCLIVDAVPAAERPYIGSSTNNTVWELILGHNGLERLTNDKSLIYGEEAGTTGNGQPVSGAPAPVQGNGSLPGNPGLNGMPGNFEGGEGQGNPLAQGGMLGGQGRPQGNPPGNNSSANTPPQQHTGTGLMRPGGWLDGGSGMNGTGTAGLLRLFQAPLATQASWLLPAALLGLLLFAVFQKKLGANADQRLGTIFWASWLLPMLAYFSFTKGLWHPYYLIMLGPGIAALVGITYWTLRRLQVISVLLCKAVLTVLSAAVVGFEIYAVYSYHYYPKYFAILLAACWLISIVLYWVRPRTWSLLLVFVAIMTAPILWSGLTALNPEANSALPQADPVADPFEINHKITNPTSESQQALIDYLLANTKEGSYLLATLSAREASPFILATNRPVLTFGGYLGSDNIIDLAGLKHLISSGELRFILNKGDLMDKSEIYTWVKGNCKIVNDLGSQKTTSSTTDTNALAFMESELYDCQGAN